MILQFIYKFIILYILFEYGKSYRISHYDSAIGRWKLLYSDNQKINIKHVDLCIEPFESQLKIKIKKYENDNLITIKKMILFTIDGSNNLETEENNKINYADICTLVLVKSQQYIKSVGILEFPYLAFDYKTEMFPKYVINWKYNPLLARLYIYFDDYTYVFEKNYYDKCSDKHDNITMNTFVFANIFSFILGKLLEKIVHLQ